MEVKRLLWGVLLGLFYAVLLLVLSLIVRGNAQGIIQSGLLNTLICLGGGAIGAFLS
jgi:putative membrane protein (TIGR04086 family)